MARRSARNAFTLLELVVATAVMSVLLVGLGSAVLLARRAVPDGKTTASAVLSAAGAMDRLASELFYGTSVLAASPTEISFIVSDRDGDESAENVRYFWSGTPGDPLLRQFNTGTEAVVAEGVQEFYLGYQKRSEPLPIAYGEGTEVLLSSYNSSTYLSSKKVDRYTWCGEYFRPSLPAQATGWRLNRLLFRARLAGKTFEEIRVQVRLAVGLKPGPTILDEVSLMESSLSSTYQWKEVVFHDFGELPPGAGVCVVFKGLVDEDACEIRTRPKYAYATNRQFVLSINSGGTWYAPEGQQMLFYAYGTVTTPGAIQYRYLLTGVQATLRTGQSPLSRLQTLVRTVNEPEVSGP